MKQENTIVSRGLLKHVFATTKGYRLLFGALFCSVIFGTVTGAAFPYAIGKIVDQIFYEQQMKGFLFHFSVYAGLYFLNQCSHGALNYLWAHLEVTYVVNLRRHCFRHLLKLKAAIWTHLKSGDVMRRIQDDTEMYLEFIHRSLFYVLANAAQLLLSIGYLLYTDILLGAIAVAMMLIMAYSVRYFTARLRKRYQKIQAEKGLVDAWILEMMTGIALKGESGCGKSTLLKLMAGYLVPARGEIRWNGYPMDLVNRPSIYARTGFLMQEAGLFNLTIRENLLFGREDATQTQIKEACARANILDFIQGLPRGFETLIGENGIRLSGGQRQRLMIARLFLQNPEFIVFDEATSALDYQNESEILNLLLREAGEKTLLMVTHRGTSIAKCGRIIELTGNA